MIRIITKMMRIILLIITIAIINSNITVTIVIKVGLIDES